MPQQETEGAPLTAEDDEPQWDHVGVSQPLLLLLFPPADSRTVTAASARPGIYASVLAADMQTPAPPLQACGASWPRCDEHVKPCGAAGERSINPHVPGPFHPSCTSFCSVLLIRRLERKTSGCVNGGWKLCSLTHSLKVCFKGPIAPFIQQDIYKGCTGDFNMTCFDFPLSQSVYSCSLVSISDQEDCGCNLSVHQLLLDISSQGENLMCLRWMLK